MRGIGRLVEPLTGRSWGRRDRGTVRSRIADYHGIGLERGDRVFLHYGNTLEFFVDLLAVWHLGACAVPVDPRLTLFEITKLVGSARPRVCVWAEDPGDTIVKSLSRLGIRILLRPTIDALTADAPSPSRLHLDDEALILFTSGTTGDPKGVVHTHRSLRARWSSLEAALGLDAYRRTLCLLPTHFGHGLDLQLSLSVVLRSGSYVLPTFRADLLVRLGELIDANGITFMSSVPTVWRLAIRTARAARIEDAFAHLLWIGAVVRQPLAFHPGMVRDARCHQRVWHHRDR